ncbi:MAG TPA: hypothetical protein VKY90_15645 [Candidatus Dormibacteraeota bacterium]|nr:hypothetical protein [Candidatus Dormibacteraeota bacterium]
MANRKDDGFGWGVIVGFALGLVAGAYLASGPGRDRVEHLRTRTIELTSSARRVAGGAEGPLRRALAEGVEAARRRRRELAEAPAETMPRREGDDA